MQSISHTTSVRVRYADTDKMGIVYNGNYLMFFEIGRTELLRSMNLPYAELEQRGFLLPVMEAHVEYKQPAYYDNVLDIHTTYVSDPGSAMLKLSYSIERDGVVLTTGYTNHAFVRSTDWKMVRPPAVFQDAVRKALALVLLLCACASISVAQQATLFPFLRYNMSARAAGLAGATNALTDDISTLFLNPAVLPVLDGPQATATFLKHTLDINSGLAAYTDHIEGFGSVAASVIYTSYGSFERADRQGVRTGTFNSQDMAIGVSYANEIDSLITYGVTAKFIYSGIDDLVSTALALDAGLLVRIPQTRTNLALSILNVGAQLSTYDGTRDRMPVDVRLGVNHRLKGLPLLVNVSLIHLADEVPSFLDRFLNFSVGGELYVGKAVRLRVGYDNSTRNTSAVNVASQLTGLSAGLGLVVKSITVDYAMSTFGSAALLHRFSLGVDL